MRYIVLFSENANYDFERLKKNEPSVFKKVKKLVQELYEHPRTGTGKPKMLKGDRGGQWSRRITRKHRLIYTINDDLVEVYVVSSYGHY